MSGNTVRLTPQAHILCSEKAEECNTSLKAVASEAIFLLAQGEDRDREHQDAIEIYKEHIAIIKRYACKLFVLGTGVGFGIGIVAGVVLWPL